jgi:hypothetical protein
MPCDDCQLVNVPCVAMKRFFVAGQRGFGDISWYFLLIWKPNCYTLLWWSFFPMPDPITCDISLSTGNIHISDYQPPLVCPSSVDLHWFISGSLRINRISLGFHQTTALYLVITFLLFSSFFHALSLEIILWWLSSFFFFEKYNLLLNIFCKCILFKVWTTFDSVILKIERSQHIFFLFYHTPCKILENYWISSILRILLSLE